MARSLLFGFQLIIISMVLLTPFRVLSQIKPIIIHLWEQGAPGFENRRNEPELVKDYWVKNIHNPSITVFLPPKEKATGVAVIICPAAIFLNSIGVAAFVLKYRLSREENSPYSITKTPREDAYRAMRLVRSRAKEFNIDTARVGMLGFSAGGEVVTTVAYAPGTGDPNTSDPIDRLNGKPNFQMLIYPGPGGIPDSVNSDAPPAFLLAANNDPCCSESIVRLLKVYRAATVPVEVHLYTQGSHGFNMGKRSKLVSLQTWPQRMADWLADNNILQPGKNKPE